MKTRRFIAALCALAMTLAAADSASSLLDGNRLSRLLTAVAEGDEQNQEEPSQDEQNQEEEAEKLDLMDAEVDVNVESQTVTVYRDGGEVPADDYNLTFYTDSGIMLGSEFPTEPGSYYVVVTARAESERFTGSAGADGENSFDVPNPYWKTDTFTPGSIGVTGTAYTRWTFSSPDSGAEYVGNSAYAHNAIALRAANSSSGIVTTTSGGQAVQMSVNWLINTRNNNRALFIYGKNEPYDSPADLYDSSKQGDLIATVGYQDFRTIALSDYKYIGIRSSSGILYLNEINITWNSIDDPTIEKTPLENAAVTVDKETETVTVTLNDEIISAENYTVTFYNEEDMTAVDGFPELPGGYIAVVRAKEDNPDEGFVNPYKGINDSGYLYIDPWYTVTIPASVKLGETAEISASDVNLAKNTALNVRLTGDFQVKLDEETDPLSYTVTQNGAEITSGTSVLTVPYGDAEGSAQLEFSEPIAPIFVGNYTGTVNFTVSIN